MTNLTEDFLHAFKTAYAQSPKVKECYQTKARGKDVGIKRWTEAMFEVFDEAADHAQEDTFSLLESMSP